MKIIINFYLLNIILQISTWHSYTKGRKE